MEIKDLASILDLYYEFGKERKDRNALIQCFGIKYADFIIKNKIKPEEIIEKSTLKNTQYAKELRKGIKLANYVCLKEDFILP